MVSSSRSVLGWYRLPCFAPLVPVFLSELEAGSGFLRLLMLSQMMASLSEKTIVRSVPIGFS